MAYIAAPTKIEFATEAEANAAHLALTKFHDPHWVRMCHTKDGEPVRWIVERFEVGTALEDAFRARFGDTDE